MSDWLCVAELPTGVKHQQCTCVSALTGNTLTNCEDFRTVFHYAAILSASKLQQCRGAFQSNKMQLLFPEKFPSLDSDYSILHRNNIPYCSTDVPAVFLCWPQSPRYLCYIRENGRQYPVWEKYLFCLKELQ